MRMMDARTAFDMLMRSLSLPDLCELFRRDAPYYGALDVHVQYLARMFYALLPYTLNMRIEVRTGQMVAATKPIIGHGEDYESYLASPRSQFGVIVLEDPIFRRDLSPQDNKYSPIGVAPDAELCGKPLVRWSREEIVRFGTDRFLKSRAERSERANPPSAPSGTNKWLQIPIEPIPKGEGDWTPFALAAALVHETLHHALGHIDFSYRREEDDGLSAFIAHLMNIRDDAVIHSCMGQLLFKVLDTHMKRRHIDLEMVPSIVKEFGVPSSGLDSRPVGEDGADKGEQGYQHWIGGDQREVLHDPGVPTPPTHPEATLQELERYMEQQGSKFIGDDEFLQAFRLLVKRLRNKQAVRMHLRERVRTALPSPSAHRSRCPDPSYRWLIKQGKIGLRLPPRLPEYKAARIVVVLDTSGSMGSDVIAQAFSLLYSFVNDAVVTVISCGVKPSLLYKDEMNIPVGELSFETDRGGTELGAAVRYAVSNQLIEDGDGLVFLTDTYNTDWAEDLVERYHLYPLIVRTEKTNKSLPYPHVDLSDLLELER